MTLTGCSKQKKKNVDDDEDIKEETIGGSIGGRVLWHGDTEVLVDFQNWIDVWLEIDVSYHIEK